MAEGVEARMAAADASAEAEAEADRRALLESTGADPNHTVGEDRDHPAARATDEVRH